MNYYIVKIGEKDGSFNDSFTNLLYVSVKLEESDLKQASI